VLAGQVGIVSEQFEKLSKGTYPVRFTRQQLQSFGFTDPNLPSDLSPFPFWDLVSENQLTGAAS
jgi:hypothetical protein